MEIIRILLSVGGGLMVLSYGAHIFVEGASRLARNLGVSSLVVGLTIVSMGTSAPEFAVNIMAAAKGNVDIALGNVVGSNIFNTAVILGLCATITPLVISQQLLKIDIPIMLAGGALCWIMGHDGILVWAEALVLAILFIGYTLLQIYLSRAERKNVKDEYDQAFGEKGKFLPESVKLVIGLGMLVVGAKFFVDGAVLGARLLGISEAVIALTIISVGTSLPEVATSVVATYKGEKDIAVGNVVGSNIFNMLGVLGFSGIVSLKGLDVNEHIRTVDIPLMTILMGAGLPLALYRQRFDRWFGPVLLLVYSVYLWHLITGK
jgi:cation:H+ antiporter